MLYVWHNNNNKHDPTIIKIRRNGFSTIRTRSQKTQLTDYFGEDRLSAHGQTTTINVDGHHPNG